MARSAIAILSTENLLHNVNVIKGLIGTKKIIAMIKANAYGHGLRSTSKRLEGKVDILGVASIEEAIILSNLGIKTSIMLMSGAFDPDDLLIASCRNFHVIFHHKTQVEWLLKYQIPLPINAWIKINTGMGRLGFEIEEGKEIYKTLQESDKVKKPIGIISHMACADLKEHPLNKKQLDNFRSFTQKFPESTKTIANSAAIFNFKDDLYDIVRPGIALYGLSPIKGISAEELGLKPVMTLQTRLISIDIRKKNESLGYGARYICQEDMKVGVIAMGYGDGYPRTAKEGTPVLINNKRCPIVGRVSMDLMTIDLRNCSNAAVGDIVTLWGEGLPLDEIVLHTDHIVNEMVCGIQNRVKFHWTSDA